MVLFIHAKRDVGNEQSKATNMGTLNAKSFSTKRESSNYLVLV